MQLSVILLSFMFHVSLLLCFFLGYCLNQPLSVVSTNLLINLCFSVFPSFNLYAYLFRVNLSKVWFFNIGITFLGFQCPLPQSVLILYAHSDLVLLSQQKPYSLVRLPTLFSLPVYSLQAFIRVVSPHLTCPLSSLSCPSMLLSRPTCSMKLFPPGF